LFSGIYVEWIEISQLILMAEASALLNLRQVYLDRTHSTLFFLSVRGKIYELTDRTAAAHLVVNHLPTAQSFLWICSQWIFPPYAIFTRPWNKRVELVALPPLCCFVFGRNVHWQYVHICLQLS
jgi:hypothetical protein